MRPRRAGRTLVSEVDWASALGLAVSQLEAGRNLDFSGFGDSGGTLRRHKDTHDGFGLSGSSLASPKTLTVLQMWTPFLGGTMVQGGDIGLRYGHSMSR